MRSMVEGAISALAPSTPLRAVPLPRCAGEDDSTRSKRRLFPDQRTHSSAKQIFRDLHPAISNGSRKIPEIFGRSQPATA
jgi:hypothetical protein